MSDTPALHAPTGNHVPAGANTGKPPVFELFHVGNDHHPENGTLLGFWLYLMSDCLIFACLFAVYGVLGRNYAAGPSGADLFDLPLVAVNTALLLFSSITYGFAMIAMQARKKSHVLAWLAMVLLGALLASGLPAWSASRLSIQLTLASL